MSMTAAQIRSLLGLDRHATCGFVTETYRSEGHIPGGALPPAERPSDLDRIEQAIRAAVRDALLRHKRDGDPVAVWREGRVAWLQPDDIPVSQEPLKETQTMHSDDHEQR